MKQERLGKELLHQRCMIHKEVKEKLLKLKKCLTKINVFATHSLDSDIEEF